MDDFEILLKLLQETPEVIAKFRNFWHEYVNYRKDRLNWESYSVLVASRDIVFSQFDILEKRIHNIINVAERIRGRDHAQSD